jgi:uracil-DNA glycosylase family protein
VRVETERHPVGTDDRTEPPAEPADARSVEDLRAEAGLCGGCELWKSATQTVFGEGAIHPAYLFVGEQPGDREDREGRPFVGPAGALLERATRAAEIDPATVYVTNAVKHFRWRAQGRRRIHERPADRHIAACRPWLAAEIHVLRPRLIVALGVTAATSLVGRAVRMTDVRGTVLPSDFGPVAVTVHPSSVLRMRGEAERHAAFTAFADDLRALRRRAEVTT